MVGAGVSISRQAQVVQQSQKNSVDWSDPLNCDAATEMLGLSW
jgi:hypothetical protein